MTRSPDDAADSTTPASPLARSDSPLARSDSPLRQIALRSGAYLAGREAAGMVVRLVGVAIVVRQIGPSAFGIYSAAVLFALFVTGLAQMGAEVYLIRLPGPPDRRTYDEAFTFLLCSSLLIVGLSEALTVVIGPWLRPVGVVLPLRILLLSIPLNVLWAPAQASIERNFAYRKMGILELGGDIVLYATAIPLALVGAGAWSLVAGYFTWQAWLLAGSAAFSGLRPRWAWSTATMRDLLRHGSGYSLSTWLTAAERLVIPQVVGGFAGAAGVGYVVFGQRLVQTLSVAQRGIYRIGMVTVSRIGRDDPDRLARAIEEGSLLLMVAAAAPFAAFGLVAHWVVPAVFGREWVAAIPVYVVLSIVAVLTVPNLVQCTVLFAFGKNLQVALSNLIQAVALTVGSLLLVHAFGIVGFGYASLLTLVATVYTRYAASQVAPIRYRRLALPVLAMLPPLLAPVLPAPWSLLTVVPPALLLLFPASRRDLRLLADVVRTGLGRRRNANPAPAAPAGPAAPAQPV
jgi:O-antigen/teichoic acid export membrane protein